MNTRMHLVIDLSHHGLGHIAQTAPVANALARRLPGMTLTVRSPAPEDVLRRRIRAPFMHEQRDSDIGIPMINALEVDTASTARAYRDFHHDLEAKIRDYSAWLESVGADAVLSNIAYVPLAAARRCGLAAIALSSINWADMLAGVIRADAELSRIHASIVQCYRSADLFMLTEPGMPPDFPIPLARIPPLHDIAAPRTEELRAMLGVGSDARLLLVSLGGIRTRLDFRTWPRRDSWVWLVPGDDLPDGRDDMHATEPLGWPFPELLGSCDALVTKPGYGLYAEAACSGVPVLSSDRPGWPEAPHLIDWMQRNASIRIIPGERLLAGDLGRDIEDLLSRPRPVPVPAGGAERAADLLTGLLQRRAR